MTRDASTPLILWICAAFCAHLMFGEGGEVVAEYHNDRLALARFGEEVRERVRFSERTFELGTVDVTQKTADAEKPPEPPPPPKPSATAKTEKVTPPKNEAKPPQPKVEAPKKVAIAVVPEDPAKKLLQTQPQMDKRIAVRQHVKPNQADNPNARFIGDEANHVQEETVATLTSHDRDDESPTPGGNHAGPDQKPGDSDQTKIAESDEHRGEKNRAPGEKGTEFDVQPMPMATRPMGATAVPGPAGAQPPRGGGDGRAPQVAANTPPPQLAPGGQGPQLPEVVQGADGNWSFNPLRSGAGATSTTDQGPGAGNKNPSGNPSSTTWLGLGGRPGPGQINLNLTQTGVVAAVGQDELRKEREADGERRKSEHRGSWTASSFERWRSAIENYVSTVKPGNQTALNTAAVPFATYLNGMHNRIHPIFADTFLTSLDSLPKDHPLNDMKLITALEIVVTRDGHLLKMGVTKTSGVTAFDIAALDSVQRASPFGPAPSAIISPDGNVYLHWEFHRDEVYACSTMNARPFLLNLPPKGPPVDPNPPPNAPPTSPSREQGAPPPVNVNETREGALPPVLHGIASG